MDQLVAALGREGHALLIDCRSLEITPIGIDTADVALVICDTGVRHELASSEYNLRRAECEEGVRILRQVLPDIDSLRDVSIEDLERFEMILPEPIRGRCCHVVSENMRTLLTAGLLQQGAFERVGELMAASHRSLRDAYQVSCAELDLMVELAGAIDGTLGARMTGGGFGGSTVNFVRRDAVDRFRDEISSRYKKATGIDPAIRITDIGDGAREEV
jgi:galactokinase